MASAFGCTLRVSGIAAMSGSRLLVSLESWPLVDATRASSFEGPFEIDWRNEVPFESIDGWRDNRWPLRGFVRAEGRFGSVRLKMLVCLPSPGGRTISPSTVLARLPMSAGKLSHRKRT